MFSLDAFVATTIAVILVLAMLSFVSVPKPPTYAISIMQKTADDTLVSLTQMKMEAVSQSSLNSIENYFPSSKSNTVLQQIMEYQSGDLDSNPTAARLLSETLLGSQGSTIGVIPRQYYYILQYSIDGTTWVPDYIVATNAADTSEADWKTTADDLRSNSKLIGNSQKIVVVSQSHLLSNEIWVGVGDPVAKDVGEKNASSPFVPGESVYCYISCRGFSQWGPAPVPSGVTYIGTQFETPCIRTPCAPIIGKKYQDMNIRVYLLRLSIFPK